MREGELGPLPVVVGLIVIWAYFESQEGVYLSARNLSNLVLQIAPIAAVAIGIVLVLLLGEIDLSVGSIAGLCSAVLGVLIVNRGWPWWGAILVMVGVGAAIGAFQGCVVRGRRRARVRRHARGLPLLAGSPAPRARLDRHGQRVRAEHRRDRPVLPARLLGLDHRRRSRGRLRAPELDRRTRAGCGRSCPPSRSHCWSCGPSRSPPIAVGSVAVLNSFKGVPTVGVILLGLVIVFSWLTTRTRFGRYVFAIGGNAEAARRAGVKISRIRIIVFALSGLMAAVGGLMFVSRLTAASTQTGAGTFLLEAIAAAVIGGTSLFGGRGTVWSALLGALVIGSVVERARPAGAAARDQVHGRGRDPARRRDRRRRLAARSRRRRPLIERDRDLYLRVRHLGTAPTRCACGEAADLIGRPTDGRSLRFA